MLTSLLILLLVVAIPLLGFIYVRYTIARTPVPASGSATEERGRQTDVEQPLGQRLSIPEDEHRIARQKLDDNAMKVVYRLLDEGYEAYLVGGCIRDLLLNKSPKDFDVATSAHPEQGEELFRRSRLIGRRFKLLHVRFGRELIEVATFRAGHDSEDNNGEHGKQAESGMILRDNVYGTIEEDALRRDFTINALYYSVADHSILDFANGYRDIKKRQIRMIGDPETRYREDPVRMLRAARFAAKLGFEIEPGTAEPIHKLGPMLTRIAPARLFDEALKLLQSGHGEASLRQLKRFDLFRTLFPQTDAMLDSEEYPVETLVENALSNTDRRLAQGKSVTPAFLFAALLWYPMQRRFQELMDERDQPALQCLHQAANEVLSEQVRSTAIPRRFSAPVREIWELQQRLPRKRRADQLVTHPRFRAAYDLLLLRETSGEDLGGLSQWWTDYQNADENQRSELQQKPADDSERAPRKRRRRCKPRKPQSDD
ncbi:polynucleotide adenylyltransferase PcnB [Marinobacterium lutimaris]|uniref:Poly(A) polymerase I n=1 Tax=Marinobacterium lutimaris TaxID=568106 RepID=A0A1H6D5A3_9GAMM|nr:polynucleotide adenylyltransferase PcnB [Marinobacterium lutimaris]SEG80431.1 poly(A) polymerase [Marinobacterium lutimaris]